MNSIALSRVILIIFFANSMSAKSIPCAETAKEFEFYLDVEDPMKAITSQIGCLIKTVEYLKEEVRELSQNSRQIRHLQRLRLKRE